MHNCNLPFQTKVSWVHFANILCHMFSTALPLLQKWQENQQRLQRSSQRHRDDQKLGVMVESLCDLSRELASRHLLRNSFLEHHSKVLQIPEDKGRSFPLLYDWGLRLVLSLGAKWQTVVTNFVVFESNICWVKSQFDHALVWLRIPCQNHRIPRTPSTHESGFVPITRAGNLYQKNMSSDEKKLWKQASLVSKHAAHLSCVQKS